MSDADVVAARDTIKTALAEFGEEGMRNLPPLAIKVSRVEGSTDDEVLLGRSVLIEPVVHPILEATLDAAGASRLGKFTWAIGLGEKWSPVPLQNLFKRTHHAAIWAKTVLFTAGGAPRDIHSTWATPNRTGIDHLCSSIEYPFPARPEGQNSQRDFRTLEDAPTSVNSGLVVIHEANHRMFVSFRTYKFDSVAGIDLDVNPVQASTHRLARPVRFTTAMDAMDELLARGFDIIADEDIMTLRDQAKNSITAVAATGAPAQVLVSVGNNLAERLHGWNEQLGLESSLCSFPTRKSFREFDLPAVGPASRTVFSAKLAVGEYNKLLADAGLDPTSVLEHPAIGDVASIEAAKPVVCEKLRDYQRIAVGMHMSTRLGYVNTLEPGMGKTVTTLDAMRRRAETTDRYRSLVVCEANVRDQWRREAAIWFPEAEVIMVTKASEGEKLEEIMRTEVKPLVVITSYALVSPITDLLDAAEEAALNATETDIEGPTVKAEAATVVEGNGQLALFSNPTSDTVAEVLETETSDLGPVDEDDAEVLPTAPTFAQVLFDAEFHDMAADEAVVLKNSSSKQTRALWQIRRNCGVAVALTGTPITKGLDDLGRLIAWVRNDEEIFHGARLDKQFPNLADPSQMDDYLAAIGPLVFRRDKSEISDELPAATTELIELQPTLAEKALAKAALEDLKKLYEELLELITLVEKQSCPDSPETAELIEAREGLQAARGAILGGAQLARMAASDPAAVTTSDSAAAEMLKAQGLVDAATEEIGTKRQWAIETCVEAVGRGEQVLLFTEFKTVAAGLIASFEEHGLKTGAVLGGGGRKRDADVAAFVAGDIDVLVATKAGEKGLNLQVASVLINYDLGWNPASLIQRAGRVERIGSTAEQIRVLFPVMMDTIEIKVATMVIARAAIALQALDSHRDTDTSKTDMGRALAGLVSVADLDSLGEDGKQRHGDLIDMTAALVGSDSAAA